MWQCFWNWEESESFWIGGANLYYRKDTYPGQIELEGQKFTDFPENFEKKNTLVASSEFSLIYM